MNEENQRHCRDRAFYAYGTSRIFERRAQSLSRRRNLITFLGVVVPLVVGGAVLSFGANEAYLPYLLYVAGFLMLLQLIVSAWSLVARWDERYQYAVGATQANTRLYNIWTATLERPPENLEQKIRELDYEDQNRESSDIAQHVTEKEKRFAMRSSLFYMKLPCRTCNNTPKSMKPSKCDTCGRF